jgi:hypothetical protein
MAATANFDRLLRMVPPGFPLHLNLRPGRVKIRAARDHSP